MGGKSDYQAYSTTQGGVGDVVADPAVPIVYGITGTTEPVWPTTEYDTVTDGTQTVTEYSATSNVAIAHPAEGDFTASNVQTGGSLASPGDISGSTVAGLIWTAIYARKVNGAVVGVLNPAVFQHNLPYYPNHYFQYGVIKWLTGQNAGFTCDVRDSMAQVTTNGVASLPYVYGLEVMPYPIKLGDTFEMTVGCSKTRYQCQLFNNMDNHRAFPDMPTEERALQTPNVTNQGYAPPANSK